jgi:hypothetical protein
MVEVYGVNSMERPILIVARTSEEVMMDIKLWKMWDMLKRFWLRMGSELYIYTPWSQ